MNESEPKTLPPLELPPLPIAGIVPSSWRFSLATPRSTLAGAVAGATLAAALIWKAWWLGAVFVPLLGWTLWATPLPPQLVRVPMLPARITPEGALVLAHIELTEGGWDIYTRSLPLLSRRGIGSEGRALGYPVRDLYHWGFLPLAAVSAPHQRALAAPGRASIGYFDLLERCAREGLPHHDGLLLTLPHVEFAAFFAREGVPVVMAEPSESGVSAAASLPNADPASHGALGEDAAELAQSWCAGFPFAGALPLGPEERAYLRRERARLRRHALLWGLHAMLGLASFAGLLLMMAHLLQGPLAGLSMAGILLWAPRGDSAWVAWTKWRQALRVERDLEDDRAWRFAGVVSDEATLSDDDYLALTGAGLLSPDLAAVQEIQVGPQSGLLLSARGTAPPKAIPLHVGSVATLPPALDVSLPPGATPRLPDGFVAKRRWLSPSERAELQRHVRRLRPIRLVLLLYALGGPLLYSWIGDRLAGWVIAVHLAIFAGLLVVSFRRWRSQVMLERELELGWLLTVLDSDGKRRYELLAVSGTHWSLAGVPAAWRRCRDL